MRRTRQRAFTLIEILVVIVIAGIATGITFALAAPDPRDVAQREARRFARSLDYALRSAQWRHEVLGVSAGGDTVRFWRRDPPGARWLAASDASLAPLGLPSPAVARALDYAGRPVAPGSVLPLSPSGRNEPFEFAIDVGDWRARVASDPLGRVSIAPPARLAR